MGPDGMHPQVLRELPDVIAKPLQIIFDLTWKWGEVSEDWRKTNVTLIFKKEDPGNYGVVILTLIHGKMKEQLILGNILRHTKEKKVIRSSQHGFTKGKSCLTNLIAFYNEVTGRYFSKASDTVSQKILIEKLLRYLRRQ
ncbi:RNA-directed DNA polymerase from mobile element jockey-like protein [Pitangus sulphuratus]|nr:RNA-directed DNA polymerase from mobile element jockey-like protein [Pitangus sulphuratus]